MIFFFYMTITEFRPSLFTTLFCHGTSNMMNPPQNFKKMQKRDGFPRINYVVINIKISNYLLTILLIASRGV